MTQLQAERIAKLQNFLISLITLSLITLVLSRDPTQPIPSWHDAHAICLH